MRTHRSTAFRTAGWLAVASMTALALLGPGVGGALALTGAVYTSNFDGSIINENTNYASKSDVYLTGGPCNGGSHLAEGDYYFEVTSPNGVLLSSDAIGNRLFHVGSNGFIASTSGTHVTHAVNCDPAATGITIQLMPYENTPNNGNEYKLNVATKGSVEECDVFDAASTSFQFCTGADQKSDNYKVGAEDPSPPPEEPSPSPSPVPEEPSPSPSPAPEEPSPSPSPTGDVGGIIGTPRTTPPPTDASGPSAASPETWRVILLAFAGLLATLLTLTPARATSRRR